MEIKDTGALKNHEDVLEALAKEIDIPEYLDQKARERYQSIGDWLDRENSSIKQYNPKVSSQGSFLLGTVIRPVGDTDHYDIDLVCTLNANKTDFTMSSLKERIGKEIIGYAKANRIQKQPEDGRRCWTLEYSDSAKFHVDILPALPDEASYTQMLKKRGHVVLAARQNIRIEAIAITDKQHPNYYTYSNDWPVSNPKGYAVWFKSSQEEILYKLKRSMVDKERAYASVDSVPDHRVKTPLQRTIQLLKRHRDTMFEGDKHKPISIIITTLSAHAYKGESTIKETIRTVLRDMSSYIELQNGAKWISNPVNPDENFADKWAEEPQKEAKFFEWLECAQRDFGNYLTGNFSRIPEELRRSLTNTTVAKIEPFIRYTTPAVAISLNSGLAEADKIKGQGGATRPWRK